MLYFILILLLILTSLSTLADDIPDIVEVARLGRGTAYTLAWRPDGEVLAVGSATGVWFFDENFNELGRLSEDVPIDSLEWSPDGEHLITFDRSYQSDDCQLIIWNISLDLQTSSQNKVFDHCAESVDWSADGNLIAIGVGDRCNDNTTVKIISANTYGIVDEYLNLGKYVAFSPDSQQLAINGSGDLGKLSIVPLDARQDVTTMMNNSPMFTPRWSSDGSMISSGCEDEEWEFIGSCVWNVESGRRAFKEWSQVLKWHPNDNSFVVRGQSFYAGFGPSISYYGDIDQTLVELPTFEFILSIEWHPSGDYITILNKNMGIDGLIANIKIHQNPVTQEHQLFSGYVKSVKWNPENLSLLSTTESADFVWRWDSTNNKIRAPAVQVTENVGTITQTDTKVRWISENEFLTISLVTDYGINFAYDNRIHDANTGEVIDTPLYYYSYFDYLTDEGGLPLTSWSNSLNQVAYTSFDDRGKVNIADKLFAEKESASFDFQADHIRQIEWSPDDSMIAVAGNIGDSYFLINIYDTTSGELISSIQRSWIKHFTNFVWSPDSNLLLVIGERLTSGGANSRTITVYKANKNYSQYSTGFDWYEDVLYDLSNVMDASWSPDSQMIAVSYHDAVKILDVNDGLILAQIPTDSINTLDWHENGQYLAGGANDGTIYVWDVSALMN